MCSATKVEMRVTLVTALGGTTPMIEAVLNVTTPMPVHALRQ
jgi:hypothetical protein